jgi:hypothetical protein
VERPPDRLVHLGIAVAHAVIEADVVVNLWPAILPDPSATPKLGAAMLQLSTNSAFRLETFIRVGVAAWLAARPPVAAMQNARARFSQTRLFMILDSSVFGT